MTMIPLAQVYYFEEFKSWGVTLYGEDNYRLKDENGDEVECEWYYRKFDAEVYARKLLSERKVNIVEVFRKNGSMQFCVTRDKETYFK